MNVVSKTVAHSRGKTVFIGLPISLEERKRKRKHPPPFSNAHNTHESLDRLCVHLPIFSPHKLQRGEKPGKINEGENKDMADSTVCVRHTCISCNYPSSTGTKNRKEGHAPA